MLGELVSIASLGLSIFGARRKDNELRKQQADYERQAEMNRQIGAFNAAIALTSGYDAVSAIAQETRMMVSEQRAIFATRGIESEGSPMMVMGETVAMGMQKAQEAFFNAKIQAYNAVLNANDSVSKASNAQEQAGVAIRNNLFGMAGQILNFGKTMSMAQQTNVKPNFNLFKYYQ